MKHKRKSATPRENEEQVNASHTTVTDCTTQGAMENDPSPIDNIPLEPGMTVACYVPTYSDEEPQIGIIQSVSDERDEVVLEWMSGTYNEPWTVCKIKQGGKYTTWKEAIQKSMVLFPIELSQNRRISVILKRELQFAYAEIRDT